MFGICICKIYFIEDLILNNKKFKKNYILFKSSYGVFYIFICICK